VHSARRGVACWTCWVCRENAWGHAAGVSRLPVLARFLVQTHKQPTPFAACMRSGNLQQGGGNPVYSVFVVQQEVYIVMIVHRGVVIMMQYCTPIVLGEYTSPSPASALYPPYVSVLCGWMWISPVVSFGFSPRGESIQSSERNDRRRLCMHANDCTPCSTSMQTLT